MKIVYKAPGQKKVFLTSLFSIKLHFDKFITRLHLPQEGRKKTGAMS